jgi:DNA-binding CsgD family transcriptional regulator
VVFIWDTLTGSLDEFDAVRAQLREARAQTRTTRFYELLRAKLVLSQGGGHVANVIELSEGWCVVHWLHDPKSVGCYSTILSLREALCIDGAFILSLVDTSEKVHNANPRVTQTRAGLTQRERDVLRGLGHGLSNKEIATQLTISAQTVKNTLSKIYRRLGVHDRVQASLLSRDLDLTIDVPRDVEN